MTLELLQHVKVMLEAAKSAGLTAEHWYKLQSLADDADKAALVPPAPAPAAPAPVPEPPPAPAPVAPVEAMPVNTEPPFEPEPEPLI